MEKKTKSLQKFTKIELKIDNLLSLEKITTEDLKPFSDSDLKKFSIVVTEKVNSLKGIEKDEFLKKIESITPKLTKNELNAIDILLKNVFHNLDALHNQYLDLFCLMWKYSKLYID